MIKYLIQEKYWRRELMLFLSLGVIIFSIILLGCSQQKSTDETLPNEFELEHFYTNSHFDVTTFHYIKIAKKETPLSFFVEYFATPYYRMGQHWTIFEEIEKKNKNLPPDKLAFFSPTYKYGELDINQFKEFWKQLPMQYLLSLPPLYHMECRTDADYAGVGILRFAYILHNQRIYKQVYISGDPNDYFEIYTYNKQPLIAELQLILAQTKFLTEEIKGENAAELIKPKLWQLYNNTNDSEEEFFWLKEKMADALRSLGKDVPDINSKVRENKIERDLLSTFIGSTKILYINKGLGDKSIQRILKQIPYYTEKYKPGLSVEGQRKIVMEIDEWWRANENYLDWNSDKFIMDEEAKTAGIPTDKYRKTHPWPKDKDK